MGRLDCNWEVGSVVVHGGRDYAAASMRKEGKAEGEKLGSWETWKVRG